MKNSFFFSFFVGPSSDDCLALSETPCCCWNIMDVILAIENPNFLQTYIDVDIEFGLDF